MGCDLSDIMYIGDSITDVQAFQLVRKSGGLTVSFNGNQYAIRNAEVAVLSKDAMITAVLADVFYHQGRHTVLKLVSDWSHQSLKKYCTATTLRRTVSATRRTKLPHVTLVTGGNMDELAAKSSSFRRSVRGETIGRLG
jgi:energy-converting hydrogenase A subunit R